MRRRLHLTLYGLVLELACQATPAEEAEAPPPQAPIVSVAFHGDPLVFPPVPTRRTRRPLPSSLSKAAPEEPIAVQWPGLDGKGHFEFTGQVVRVRFNRPIQLIPKSKEAPLTITPSVPGKAQVEGAYSVTFTAKEPFDPDQTYTVELGPIEQVDGKAVPPWTATFRADPEIWIAGKQISYVPKPGEPRVIALRPWDGATISATKPNLQVLFDQPVDVDAVKDLLELETVSSKEAVETVPVRLSHPRASEFAGVEVDRRHVVLVQPTRPLAANETYQFSARDHASKPEDAETLELEVAEPLGFESVRCDNDPVACTWYGSQNRLELSGRDFVLAFNNKLPTDTATAAALRVEPAVPNLSVWVDPWSEGGRLRVYGPFEPSREYTVSLRSIRDIYGSSLFRGLQFKVQTAPLPASATIPEGVHFLGARESQAFSVTTRNVEQATLSLYDVGDTDAQLRDARLMVLRRERPAQAPTVSIPIPVTATENRDVTSSVNLLEHVRPGRTYITSITIDRFAFGALSPVYPPGSWAANPSIALLTVNDDRAIAVHARSTPNETLVHVARLYDGSPLPGANVFIGDTDIPAATTNAQGLAAFPIRLEQARSSLVRVRLGDERAALALGYDLQTHESLAPEFASGETTPVHGVRALLLSDRGIYRPGAIMHFKASVRRPDEDARLRPVSWLPLQVRLLDPNGQEVLTQTLLTNDMGSIAFDHTVDPAADVGRYRAVVEIFGSSDVLAATIVQVAEFEPPRFKVDVDARAQARELEATVTGRYLFGAAMENGQVSWSLRRAPAPMPEGPLTARGFVFRPQYGSDDALLQTGSGTLDKDGEFAVAQALELVESDGPQRFTLEAEVTDSSHRAIANRGSVIVHPTERYAGLRLDDRWPAVGVPLPLELGVIDQEGHAIAHATIEATLERIEWKQSRRPGPGGSVRRDWKEVRTEVGRCTAATAAMPVRCDLVPERSGSYEVTAKVDGRTGGNIHFWAWGSDGYAVEAPTTGHNVELTADLGSYEPGQTATLTALNPFARATAIWTVEQGAVLHREAREVAAGPITFTLPLEGRHAPHVHATVTLLPRGATDEQIADWRFGAIRLPVAFADVRLQVSVTSDRPHYEPGEAATITIAASHGGAPVPDAEVVLAVVDEGVLRMTNFHAPDPIPLLYPGSPLWFAIADTRVSVAQMFERSRIAGDGESAAGDASIVSTRKNFVETALWAPDLRTDADGNVTTTLTLPDNLTQFRMMAVVLDDEGRGSAEESAFEVRKPLMGIPAVPRFALTGDRFEAAIMVHSGLDEPTAATVELTGLPDGPRKTQIDLPAGGQQRVAFDVSVADAGLHPLTFEIRDHAGSVRDRVEAKLPVQVPGIDERPRIASSFVSVQEIALQIPTDVRTDFARDEALVVTMGRHLWPELGARLEYLIDYPHGCVEQTTSSTLPLLAARDVLPRLGFAKHTAAEIDVMIVAGIERLALMKTSTGGLAYWPGDPEPSVYGTAYAMRAVALAHRVGLKVPAGLREGMIEYLLQKLQEVSPQDSASAEIKASIAFALAEAQALPESSADMLMDSAAKQGLFGLASLALALSTLPGQADHLTALLDPLEAGFSGAGHLVQREPESSFDYYGSSQRTQAQALMALTRLRPNSKLVAPLVDELIRATEAYTTQATAFGLLALREQIVTQGSEPVLLRAKVDGNVLEPDREGTERLGGFGEQYRIPFAKVAGRTALLRLESNTDKPVSFLIEAKWRRPYEAQNSLAATSSERGPEVYRIYTDTAGRPIDPATIRPTQIVRVALMARLPTTAYFDEQLGYLAMTDRIPAGFEPVQPDLWTVSRPGDLTPEHPLYSILQWGSPDASHVALRDDRVHMYFDRIWGEYVAGTYFMRATTPGHFVAPPAMAELMYEPDSTGYASSTTFEVSR